MKLLDRYKRIVDVIVVEIDEEPRTFELDCTGHWVEPNRPEDGCFDERKLSDRLDRLLRVYS